MVNSTNALAAGQIDKERLLCKSGKEKMIIEKKAMHCGQNIMGGSFSFYS